MWRLLLIVLLVLSLLPLIAHDVVWDNSKAVMVAPAVVEQSQTTVSCVFVANTLFLVGEIAVFPIAVSHILVSQSEVQIRTGERYMSFKKADTKLIMSSPAAFLWSCSLQAAMRGGS